MDNRLTIFYEDKQLLVCRKPVGVLAESCGKGGSLPELADAYLRENGETCNVRTVHRLDRGVGGLTILAKTAEAAGKLSAQIAKHQVEKDYLAVVRGEITKETDVFRDLLFRDAAKGKTYVVNRMRKGVREASLEYQLLGKQAVNGEILSLVRIRLHTGRTHQIRVQFASRKFPLYGDGRYGSRDGGEEPALFAFQLCFRHPFQKKPICCRCIPTECYPFSLFQTQLYALENEEKLS